MNDSEWCDADHGPRCTHWYEDIGRPCGFCQYAFEHLYKAADGELRRHKFESGHRFDHPFTTEARAPQEVSA